MILERKDNEKASRKHQRTKDEKKIIRHKRIHIATTKKLGRSLVSTGGGKKDRIQTLPVHQDSQSGLSYRRYVTLVVDEFLLTEVYYPSTSRISRKFKVSLYSH